ncbi:unnamed protein product [Dovyalis caffra]|uniref:SET domain-containing protein n=1 Tax=Dovyalis caffra TaxID=77055 RepID=A0AAV1RZU8_9ROSI|nr:unnamed protein product [Dovyalis caffra]
MEKIKCAVPESIKRMVGESSDDDLASTSSTLLHCLLNLPQFQRMIDDLADPNNGLCGKNKDGALELKQKGNRSYLTADYNSALASYSQALRLAPMDALDMEKNLVATLYLNRASLFHKIGFLTESVRDCKRALQISPTYAKAWYRRGKVNADLGNYKDAVNDLDNAKSFELSLDGKRQIETELNIIIDRQKHTSRTWVGENENCSGHFDELQQSKLSRVTTPDKGRGMASQCDIPQASLVHKEEPYALIILKSCRETHCHYCLNQLPADPVPCTACTIPLYCSEHCQLPAGGEAFSNFQDKFGTEGSHSRSHEEHIAEVNAMAIVRIKSSDVHDPPDQSRKHNSIGDALTSSVEQVAVGQAIYKAASLFNHSCLPNIHAYFLSRSLFIRTTEYVSTGCPLELSYGPQVGQLDCKDRLKYLEDKYSFQCQCHGCSQLNLSDLVLSAFCCVNPNCAGIVLKSPISNGEIHKFKNFPRAPAEQNLDTHLQEAIVSKDISGTTLLDASRALGILRSTLHAYNKSIAEAEDNLAQALCFVRDLQSAREHCKASIKILETLYDPDHIVIGYELVKLASIQLSLDDPAAVDSINHLGVIFERYFGPHVDSIVPYLRCLKSVAFQ